MQSRVHELFRAVGLAGRRKGMPVRRYALGTAAAALAFAIGSPAPALVLNDNFNGNGFTVISTTSGAQIPNGIDAANVFNNVVSLDGGSCTGTLVNSRTVLTAAHCFFDNKNQYSPMATVGFTPTGSATASTTVNIVTTIVNPRYNGAASSNADIALVILATPVTNITPVNLLTLQPTDPNFPGKGTPIALVGFGNNGTGTRPPTRSGPNDNQRRAGQSTLGSYQTLNAIGTIPNGGTQNGFGAQFRDPANPATYNYFNFTAGQAQVTTAEAGTASGDSGGPIFYCPLPGGTGCTPNQLVQIGTLIGGGQPTAGAVASAYGDVSGWTPVNLFQAFITGNNGSQSIAALAGTANWSSAAAWSGGALPGTTNVAWLSDATTMTLDSDQTVSALWLTFAQASLAIDAGRTLNATAGTTVNNGTLSVAGMLNTPLLSLTGGVLSGIGTIATSGGIVANYAASVKPGTATTTGTLTIQGDYLQAPGSALMIKAGSVSADKLAVTNAATIGGALQLSLIAQGRPIGAGTSYSVLTANTLTGTFATSTTQPSAFIGATTTYTGSAVNVALNRTATYASVAQTDNTRNFAASLDKALAQGNPRMNSLLGRLDASNAAEADKFYAEQSADGGDESDVLGNQLLVNLATAWLVQDALDQHLASLRDGTSAEVQRAAGVKYAEFSYSRVTGTGVTTASGTDGTSTSTSEARGAYAALTPETTAWLRVLSGWQHLKDDGNAFGLKQNTAGVVGGIDLAPFDHAFSDFRGGIGFSFLRSQLGGTVERGTTDTYSISLYGTQPFGHAYVDGHLTYGYSKMSTERDLDVLGLQATATGDTHGNEWAAALNTGYRWMSDGILLEPSAGVSYIRVTRVGFTESGADVLDLIYHDSSLESLRGIVGLRAQEFLPIANDLVLRPELRAQLSYDARDVMPTTTAAMQDIPADTFSFEGVNVGRIATLLGAGLTLASNKRLALHADYSIEMRQYETVQAAWGGLRVTW